MNHQALITFITSLTLWACRSARENGTSNKGPPQPQPPSVHSKCENLSNYGFYKILLTFHLLSFSHSRPPPTKHPRLEQFCTPNLLAQLREKLWRTKQPNSNSPSTPLSLSPCAFVDSTRSPRVKTDRGHTIISNPLISGPWPRQHGDSQSKVLGPQSTDQQGRTVNLITSQIFGLQTSRSGFIQQSCQTLSPSYQRIFHPQVTATRESFFSV